MRTGLFCRWRHRASTFLIGKGGKVLKSALLSLTMLKAENLEPPKSEAEPNAPAKTCPNVGGQAVIEGVMMRGPNRWSVTVRRADGSLESQDVPYMGWAKRRPILGKPILRGAMVLLESMIIGLRALNFSAEIAAGDEDVSKKKNLSDAKAEAAAQASTLETEKKKPALGFWALAGTIGLAFLMAIVLFVALPHWLSALAGQLWNFNDSSPYFHLIDGVIKFAFFMAYVWGIGLLPDIKRVYAYHGAEHQAIYTFEAGEDLIPENAERHPRAHPRCGTAFIFLVLALSIIFFAAIFPIFFDSSGGGWLRTVAGIGLKIVLMFPLAGLAYEVTRLAGKAGANSFWRALLWPGLLLQKLTTRPADHQQLEVALCSLKKALDINN